jgi:hypothetical protein
MCMTSSRGRWGWGTGALGESVLAVRGRAVGHRPVVNPSITWSACGWSSPDPRPQQHKKHRFAGKCPLWGGGWRGWRPPGTGRACLQSGQAPAAAPGAPASSRRSCHHGPMTAMYVLVGIGLGYLLRCWRPARRALAWAQGQRAGSTSWWLAQPVLAVAVVTLFVRRPLQSRRNVRSWAEDQRPAAPQFDPEWAARRRTS